MKIKAIAIIILGMGLASCDYQVNNTIKQPDVRKGDSYVYGVHPDSLSKRKKPLNLDEAGKQKLEQDANAIREKLSGANKRTNAGA